jgi:hypothetical protein
MARWLYPVQSVGDRAQKSQATEIASLTPFWVFTRHARMINQFTPVRPLYFLSNSFDGFPSLGLS